MRRALCVLLILVVVRPGVWAGEKSEAVTDSIPVYHLGEIVVEAPSENKIRTATIHTVAASTIQRLEMRAVPSALNFVPGLYLSHSQKNETTLQIRGFAQRQISVYLDGVPISVPFDGLLDLSQLVGDDYRSIRISRGVSSILYGANTLGGTVNILTGTAGFAPGMQVRLEGASGNHFYGRVRLSLHPGRWNLFLSASLDTAAEFRLPAGTPEMPNEEGGSRDNSAFRKENFLLKATYAVNAYHQLGVHFSFINNSFGVPPNALSSRPRYWKFPEWKKFLLGFNTRHQFGEKASLRTVWFADRYRNRLESYDDATYTTQTRRYAFTSIYDDYSLGVMLYPSLSVLPVGKTNAVLSFKHDVHREASAEQEPFEVYSAQTVTAGLEQLIHLSEQWDAVVGVDGDYLRPVQVAQGSLRDPIFLMNAQLALQFRPDGEWQVHVALGSKSRFPTLKELYSERLGTSIANPDLKEERSWNNELGVLWQHGNWHVQTALFYNRLRDLITMRYLEGGVRQMQNVGRAELSGAELALRWQLSRARLEANYTYLVAKDISPERTSSHLEYRPKHRFNFLGAFPLFAGVEGGLELSYAGDQYFVNPDTHKWEKLNDFAVMNLRLSYQPFPLFQVYFRVNNLWDRFYYSEYGVPMPGREFIAGVRIGK